MLLRDGPRVINSQHLKPKVPAEAKVKGVPREFLVRFSESGEGARGAQGGAKESCGTPGEPLELSARWPSLYALRLSRARQVCRTYTRLADGKRLLRCPENERGMR